MQSVSEGSARFIGGAAWRKDAFGVLHHPGIVLLFLPVFVAALNAGWLFTVPGAIDPWIYFGYFMHLSLFKASWFPGTYYGSRLSWILPGHWLHQLADPITAKYILHFSLIYLSLFSFYYILKTCLGGRRALLTSVLLGTNALFLHAMGWDYIDGPGIAFNLAALAAAAKAGREQRSLWLLLAGMLAAAMVYCNLFLLVFVPFVPIFYLCFCASRPSLKTALGALGWFVSGTLALSAVLAVVNYDLEGRFWFYAPSIEVARSLTNTPNPWALEYSSWLWRAYWLGLPAVAVAVSLLVSVQRTMRRSISADWPSFAILVQMLGLASLYVITDLRGGIMLQLTYYTSYLLPAVFLAIGCFLPERVDRLTKWQYTSIVWMVLLAFSATLRLRFSTVAAAFSTIGVWVAVALGAAVIVTVVLLQGRWNIWLALLGFLWFYQTGFLLSQIRDYREPYQEQFARIVLGVQNIRSFAEGRQTPVTIRFWYDDLETPHGQEFNALNSVYLWGYTIAGNKFPALWPQVTLQPGMTVILLSSREDALSTAVEILKSQDLVATPVHRTAVSHAGKGFDMIFLSLDRPARD